MTFRPYLFALRFTVSFAVLVAGAAGPALARLEIRHLASHQIADGAANGGAEIVAYDPAGERLFAIIAASAQVEAIDIGNPRSPRRLFTLDLAPHGGGVNSVAVHDGVVAVAVQADDRQAPGKVVFFSTAGELLSAVTVGALPDMLVFTPDGHYLLVANEGEPRDYCSTGLAEDPEGSVSIVDLSGGVANLGAAAVRTVRFDGLTPAALPEGVRIFGPGASVAQDLEPEYIAVSEDSRRAWVTLQENNAIAILDIPSATLTGLQALGTKDHSRRRNAFDPSDRDDGIHIAPHPVHGLYQPDAIAAFRANGRDFLVTANEGDARAYECFSEEERVGDLTLDAARFPRAAQLQENEVLGRLRTTNATGDQDGDGDHDRIETFGARSFAIWSGAGTLIWDSGDDLERRTAAALPADFNSNNDENGTFDARSDDKGPEPEGVAVALFQGRRYAFVALERVSAVAIYDITKPAAPLFETLVTSRHFGGDVAAGTAGDLGPESVLFIPRPDSPAGVALLIVGNEISGTVAIFSVRNR